MKIRTHISFILAILLFVFMFLDEEKREFDDGHIYKNVFIEELIIEPVFFDSLI